MYRHHGHAGVLEVERQQSCDHIFGRLRRMMGIIAASLAGRS